MLKFELHIGVQNLDIINGRFAIEIHRVFAYANRIGDRRSVTSFRCKLHFLFFYNEIFPPRRYRNNSMKCRVADHRTMAYKYEIYAETTPEKGPGDREGERKSK